MSALLVSWWSDPLNLVLKRIHKVVFDYENKNKISDENTVIS